MSTQKPQRISWNKFQKAALVEAFNQDPYLTPERLTELSEHLGRREGPIKNWFRNKRRIITKKSKPANKISKNEEIFTNICRNEEKISAVEALDFTAIEPDLIFKYIN